MVYSRRKIFTEFTSIDYKESFKNLCETYPNAFRYLFNDGKNALANIDKHIQKLDSDKVFSKVKELLVRDSEHLR